MKLSRPNSDLCKKIAESEGVSLREVRKAVSSYFDSVVSIVRRLPYDSPRKIYSRGAFLSNSPVVNIPYIGRIGPVYSLYLKWRKSESRNYDKVPREHVRKINARPIIEEQAKLALAGEKVNLKLLKERIPRGKYGKVWLIDSDGKRKAAKQLIINPKNVQD